MKRDLLYTGIITVIGSSLLLAFFIGPSGPDEFLYLSISNRIDTNGIQEYLKLADTSLRYLKVVYNLLIALPIILMGYNFFSYTAISLISYLLISVLIYFFVRQRSGTKTEAIIASVLFMSMPASIYYASIVLPEMIHALFIFCSLYLLMVACKSEKKTSVFLLLSGIFWGLSFYLREHSVFIFPVYLYFIVKYRAKLRLKFLYIALGYALIFAIINGIVFLNTGDFFYQWTFAKMRFGGVDPEKTAFFETIGPSLYYTIALFTRIDYFGLIVLGITGLLIYHFLQEKKGVKILFDDVFYIILFLFISYEIIYRIILPVPRTIAYVSPIFPFLAVYLSRLIMSIKSTEISVKRFTFVFLIFLLISLLIIFTLKLPLLTELTNRLSGRDTYLVNSEPRALLYFRLIIISLFSLVFIGIIIYASKISSEIKLQLLVVSAVIIPSVFILTPFRTHKSIDFVKVNKELTSFIFNSEIRNFYVHDGYQRSPLISFSDYKFRDGFLISDNNCTYSILPLDSLKDNSEGYIIVDSMIIEQKAKLGLDKRIVNAKLDSLIKLRSVVFRSGKIIVYGKSGLK